MTDFLKCRFFESRAIDVDDIQNPWAGLSSYEDPETSERELKFCGRDDDSYDLARLIMGNVFVTLYGKSGIGKTSLLNAGVFPELREYKYTPVSLRLGMRDEDHPQSYQSMIIEAIERLVEKSITVKVIDEQKDHKAIDFLWNYFTRHRFYNRKNEPITPVLVFDQFEEVFFRNREEVDILLRQLDYLSDKDHTLDCCNIEGFQYRYEQNFRFVVSIREDDLYRLEDCIDNCFLPSLKRCRYRLHSLSEDGARAAILNPGKGLYNTYEQEFIADTIINKSRNDDGSINTILMSLLCSRIYLEFKKSNLDHITLLLVDSFIKGDPFERYYKEATRGLSYKGKCYIEDHLVDSKARRNSISEDEFLSHVKNGLKLLEGKNRILQRISSSSDNKNHRVELIHDSFCFLLNVQKERRERKKRFLHVLLMMLTATLLVMGIVWLNDIRQRNEKLATAQYLYLAEKVISLIASEDSYTAKRLALRILPKRISPDVLYFAEAENALRQACLTESAILRGHSSGVNSAKFSPNGKYIVSSSIDGTLRIWDVFSGQCLKVLETNSNMWGLNDVSFCPNGNHFIVAFLDTIRIYDTNTGCCMKKFKTEHEDIHSLQYSPDGKHIISPSFDGTISIWDAYSSECLNILQEHKGRVYSAQYSPDGKQIVSGSNDGTLRIWDSKTGKCLRILRDEKSKCFFFAQYSPDGKYIVSASPVGTLLIWDANNGKCLKALNGHTAHIHSAQYSPDGKQIVSGSNDGTLRIWDVETGECLKIFQGHTGAINSVQYSPDGEYVVSASSDGTLRIWDVCIDKYLRVGGDFYDFFDYSPDGEYVVSASADGTLQIWYSKTGECIKKLRGCASRVEDAKFSPDGKYIVSASVDRTLRVWDVNTGKCVMALIGHRGIVRSVQYSPNGKNIVSASDDGTLRIWNTNNGQCLKVLHWHTGHVSSVQYSPDGKRIILNSELDGIYQRDVWDVNSGKCLNSFHTFFISDDTLDIWKNTRSVNKIITNDHINRLEFGHNGDYLFLFCRENLMIINMEYYQISLILRGDYKMASFSPNGRQIRTLDYKNRIELFDFPPLQELIDSTQSRFVNNPLSTEEKHQFHIVE